MSDLNRHEEFEIEAREMARDEALAEEEHHFSHRRTRNMTLEKTHKQYAAMVADEAIRDLIQDEYEGREDDYATRLDFLSVEDGDAVIAELYKIRKALQKDE